MKREPKSFEEMLLFSVPLIKVKYENNSEAQGTSFFISYKNELENTIRTFLVTNKHVIENSISQKIYLHYKDENDYPILNEHREIELKNIDTNWILDEQSDIAILDIRAKLNKYKNLYYQAIPLYYEKLKPKDGDIDVIEDVVFIGYPNGLYDKKNLLPIVRKGITATSYNFDFNGEAKFLIDASVFQGSSGSPIFIIDRKNFLNNKKNFLGILASVYFKDDEHIVDEKTHFTRQMINIGVVYKSSEIEKLIEKYIEQLNSFLKDYEKIKNNINEKNIDIFLKKHPMFNLFINKLLFQQKNNSLETINNLTDFENEEIEVIKEWIEDYDYFVFKIRDTIANDFQNEDNEIVKKAKIISNLFKKYDSNYPKNVIITRGLEFDISDEKAKKYFKSLYEIFYDSFKYNYGIIFDLAPMSASKDRYVAEGFANTQNKNFYSIVIDFKIRHTNEIDLSMINKNEKEILINGNLIYKVVSFEVEREKNIYFIVLEEIEND